MDIDGASPAPGEAGDAATEAGHDPGTTSRGPGTASRDATGPSPGDPAGIGRTVAFRLAATCGAAVVALVVVAAVVPPPDRLARGLLVVVALVLLIGVSIGWLRTVRLLAERTR